MLEAGDGTAASSFYITQDSEGEGDAAGYRAVGLREKESTAIRRYKRAVSLGEQVAHIHHRLRSARKDAPDADRLAKQDIQICIAGRGRIRIHRGDHAR